MEALISDAVQAKYDVASIMGGLYGEGLIALRGAFQREWADQIGHDIEVLFEEALQRPDGAVGRGPKRYYVEIHPERISGFVALATPPGSWPSVRVCWALVIR